MKLTVMGNVAAIGWMLAAPFAHAQQPAAAPVAEPAHKVYVLTGCLTASADASGFTLTDASPVGRAPAPKAASETVGTSGQKPEYALQPVSGMGQTGVDAAGLKAHVGTRVEVTTRPVDVAPAAPASGSSPGGTPATPIEPAPERYAVTAIKRATGTCAR